MDTATASQLVAQIKDQLHVKEAANTDLLVTANEELVKAEQTLADSKVSQEEVDALVARLTNVLDQLCAVETPQVKEDKNDKSTQEATPEIKPEVAKQLQKFQLSLRKLQKILMLSNWKKLKLVSKYLLIVWSRLSPKHLRMT